MHRVIHFEISVSDVDKAIDFYSSVFGWTITKTGSSGEDYYLIHTGSQHEKGINGGMKRRNPKSPNGFINTVGTDDIKASVKLVTQEGGRLVDQVKTLPGTGYLAYCEDPEGNLFAILQYDSDAR